MEEVRSRRVAPPELGVQRPDSSGVVLESCLRRWCVPREFAERIRGFGFLPSAGVERETSNRRAGDSGSSAG